MVIIGIVLYEQNVSKNVSQPWYVWFLLIGGIILAIIGGILFAWGLVARSNASANTTTTTTVYQPPAAHVVPVATACPLPSPPQPLPVPVQTCPAVITY